MPGEFDFIAWLRAQQRRSALCPVPAGDDLAVLAWPAADLLLVGVDQALDGVHFDSAIHAPRQIGAKVMNRNLSDCAAMACLPAAAVVAVALPRGSALAYAQALYLGMKDAAAALGCEIVGGDTGSWPGRLACSVTILGRAAGVAPVTRAGARPGDFVYVTGPLGGSMHLDLDPPDPELRVGRHMTFAPRVHLARQLATSHKVTAMLDLSDGLSRDLAHVCRESGVGATIDATRIPVHPHAHAHALANPAGPGSLARALHDGEDYELLFTSPDDVPPGLATRIGTITAGADILLSTPAGHRPLPARGWQHAL